MYEFMNKKVKDREKDKKDNEEDKPAEVKISEIS